MKGFKTDIREMKRDTCPNFGDTLFRGHNVISLPASSFGPQAEVLNLGPVVVENTRWINLKTISFYE